MLSITPDDTPGPRETFRALKLNVTIGLGFAGSRYQRISKRIRLSGRCQHMPLVEQIYRAVGLQLELTHIPTRRGCRTEVRVSKDSSGLLFRVPSCQPAYRGL